MSIDAFSKNTEKYFWYIKKTRNKMQHVAHDVFESADSAPENLYVSVDHIVKENKESVSPSHVWNSWGFWISWATIVLISYFVFQSLELLYILLAGLIISMASEKMIMTLSHRISRGWAIAITYTFFILFVLAGALVVFPFLAQQIASMLSLLVEQASDLQTLLQDSDLVTVIWNSEMNNTIKWFIISLISSWELWATIQESLLSNISQIVTVSSGYIKNIWDILVWVVGGFFSGIAQVVILFTVAVFFSIEKEQVVYFFQKIWWRTMQVDQVFHNLYHRLWSWLKGQFFLSLFIWVAVAICLVVLSWFGIDLPHKFTLSLIAGLTEFIPYIWPILWGIPALMVATLTYGWAGFFSVWLVYFLIQQAENNILVPLVMNHAVWVSPLLVFLSMLISWSLLWLIGVLIAVPIAVILNVLRNEYHAGSLIQINKDEQWLQELDLDLLNQ